MRRRFDELDSGAESTVLPGQGATGSQEPDKF